jgi:hypothetical protein
MDKTSIPTVEELSTLLERSYPGLAASLRLIPKGITANDPFDYAKFWTDYTRLGKEINPETQICFLKMFQTILEGLPAEERLSVLYALTATRNALVQYRNAIGPVLSCEYRFPARIINFFIN